MYQNNDIPTLTQQTLCLPLLHSHKCHCSLLFVTKDTTVKASIVWLCLSSLSHRYISSTIAITCRSTLLSHTIHHTFQYLSCWECSLLSFVHSSTLMFFANVCTSSSQIPQSPFPNLGNSLCNLTNPLLQSMLTTRDTAVLLCYTRMWLSPDDCYQAVCA